MAGKFVRVKSEAVAAVETADAAGTAAKVAVGLVETPFLS